MHTVHKVASPHITVVIVVPLEDIYCLYVHISKFLASHSFYLWICLICLSTMCTKCMLGLPVANVWIHQFI